MGKVHERYDAAGTPDEKITNPDGTSGSGDVSLGVRYGLLVNANDLLMGSVSLRVPTRSDSVSLSPGIRFGPGKELKLYSDLQIPVYQDVKEAQPAPRFGFIVGLSKRF